MAVLGNTSVISLTLLDGVIGNLNPKTTNVYTLGTSSLKWNNVYATTFTGNLTGNATISAKDGFTYSGIGTASDNVARPIWFAYNGVNGRPVIDNDFKYNPSNNTITIGAGSLSPTQYTGNAATATTASKLSNTSAVGAADRPVYFTNGGVPSQTTYRMAATNVSATGARAITDNLETGIWYVNGTNVTGLYSQSDGAAYVNKYSDSWIAEIYQDYRTGQIAVRGKNNGTWQAWRQVLDSSNYTTYTVTKTGSGASGTWGISVSGNAATATKFASAQSVTLTGDVTGTASSQAGWSIATTIGAGKVTNAMLAGSIANAKLANSSITIAGNSVALGGSLAADTLRASLGLSSAMHFIGKATVAITDGSTTDPAISGYTTKATGDVVIDKDNSYEYVWTAEGKWERLGPDGSYSLSTHTHGNITNNGQLSTASRAVVTDASKNITVADLTVSNPTDASSEAISFIDTISQSSQGKITPTRKSVRVATASASGVVSTTAQTFAGVKTFDNGIHVYGTISTQGTGSAAGTMYPGGAYHSGHNSIVLHGDSAGVSGIGFTSETATKSGTTTNINGSSDRAFIQYHAHGVTAAAEGTAPTLATSGELGTLVIGVGNDATDTIRLQAPGATGILHQIGATAYPIPHTSSTNGTVGAAKTPVYVSGGVITAGTEIGASAYHPDTYFVKAVTSTDNAIVRYSGTTGQVQNSAITINDSGVMTANASGQSISDIKFFTGTANAGKTYIGWIKFASIPMNTSNHWGQKIYDIHLNRSYNSPSSEVYSLRVSVGWGTTRTILLGGSYGGHIMTKFRVVRDNTNHIAYFEYYVNPDYNQNQNIVYIRIIQYYGSDGLALINEVQTEEDSALAGKEEIDLINGVAAATFTGDLTGDVTGNLTGNATIQAANGFTYSGIGTASDNAARPIWFAYNGVNGRPVIDNDFKYNPSNNTITIGTGSLSPTQYSGNAATATKTGVANMWLYPENNNELNIGGTNNSTTIFFGYRAKDSRAIPTKFVFGSSTGTADIQVKTVYLGSGTSSYISSTQYTGNAATATKWAAAQKVYVTLGTASTTTTIQGGSTSAQTIGIDGTLGTAHGGTGNTAFTKGRIIWAETATKLADAPAMHINWSAGTTNARGYEELVIGNSTDAGTANNAFGRIAIYSGRTTGSYITAADVTSGWPNHVLPATAGWLVTAGNGSSTGAGSTYVPVYVSTAGLATACSSPSALINLASNDTDTLFKASPRPGVTGTLGVVNGGTGATSFAANSVIMSGSSTTAALTTRTVTNNTSNTAIAANTNIPTMNTIYYGLAVINNASQTRGVSIYAPTAGGTAGYPLIGAGTTTAPAWYGGTVFTGTAAASWKTDFNGTTDATSTTAAAVVMDGGLGVAKQLRTGGSVTLGTLDGNQHVINGSVRIESKNGSYNEGLRINRSSTGYANIYLGGIRNSTSGNQAGGWWIGTLSTPADASSTSTSTYFQISHNSTSTNMAIRGTWDNGWIINPRLTVGTATLSTTYTFYVNGTSYFNNNMIIEKATASTTKATGALVIKGTNAGLGVVGQVNAETFRVNEKVKLEYNATDDSLDFVWA